MKKVSLLLFFLLALGFNFLFPFLIPNIKFLAFAPFLVIVYPRVSLLKALWIAIGCGLIMDLFCSEMHFGLHALNYFSATLLIYRFRRRLFIDKSFGLGSYTALFSLLSTLIQFSLAVFYHIALPLPFDALFSDFVLMPILDGIYAFLWFYCPVVGYDYVKRKRAMWLRVLKRESL